MKLRFWIFALIALVLIQSANPARAETFTFAVGEWPPYVGSDEPHYGTHARTITNAFASAGHIAEYKFMPWRRAMKVVEGGSVPATFPWVYTEDRAKRFFVPDRPITTNNFVMFYRKDRFPDGLPALTFDEIRERGLTVVAVQNYWYEKPLEEAKVTVETVVTEAQAWTMLQYERADIFIDGDDVGIIQKAEFLGDAAEEITHSPPIHTVPLYILFSKTHPHGKKMLELWDGQMPEEDTKSQAIQ
ncbi:substrate-binding periplasmic protein [Roseibium sp.]|uniref:substrate-binding periplasmic protein n=1 Tax=Roseibium sp. TaxID=1936156 RepID=UPI003B521B4B